MKINKILIPIFICLCLIAYTIGYSTTTTTTNLSLVKIDSEDMTVDIFDTMNDNLDLIDAIFDTVSLTEYSYLDGVTSAIQTQLNAKQTLDAQLTDIAGLTPTGSYFIVGDGTNFITESGATARTSLGIDLSLYYLKTEIDTQGEIETIWGTTLATDTELAALEFTDLTDTPANYTGSANKFLQVNATPDALVFDTISSDDLSDVASIGMLDEAETVTGSWEFPIITLVAESDTTPASIEFDRARDGTPTYDVSSGDVLGLLNFYGYTTTGAYDRGALIQAVVDGTPGDDSSDMPGRLEFSTTPDGSDTPLLRMAIDNAGNIKMGDGAWTSYVNVSAAGVLTFEGTANIEGIDATELGYLNGISAFGGSIIDDADASAARTTLGLVIGTNVLAEQTIGIANDNLLEVDDADAAVDDYCKLTANGIVGRSYSEVKTDLGIDLSLYYLKTEMDSFSELQTIISDKTLVNTTNKLSDFAATTSAELAGVISDETGIGKAVFNTAPTIKQRVTTKTGTCTLTVDEAGTVLVSASSAYTVTLPTAVDNAGLTYHFIKTDANYNLITLDGDGTETIDYENSTGAPCLTYPRLNTYRAGVTLTSDNANWQVIDEAMGQAPQCVVYLSAQQSDITHNTWIRADLDTEQFDIGNNFNNSTWVSGNATSTSAGHLVDSGGAFTAAMVNKRVKNTTDTTYTYITAYNSATDLTVRDDIFVDTEGYEIKNAKFVAPIPGRYLLMEVIAWSSPVVSKKYSSGIKNNNSFIFITEAHSSNTATLYNTGQTIWGLSTDDYVELFAFNYSGADTSDLTGVNIYSTSMQIRLLSKD